MGKGSAEIEQEIRAKRKAISAKVDEMTQRGADDVREAADRVQELFDSTPITKTADEHPFLTLAGALGLGVVLGMASESVNLGGLLGGGKGSSPPDLRRVEAKRVPEAGSPDGPHNGPRNRCD